MIFNLLRFIVRNLSDRRRLRLMTACLLESGMLRPGGAIDIHLHFTGDGKPAYVVTGAEWSYPKKDLAREMLRNGCALPEVADVFCVSTSELTNQLLDREPHNNISHCNATGCDGVQCGNEHMKGDF